MGAPALLKTWQIEPDILIPVGASNLVERRQAMLAIVNNLIGFASNPMTVIGSGNGVTSGMDATNRWATEADLVNNSWIVLQDAQVNAKFQICIHLYSVWTTGNACNIQIVVSRLAGFGTANGGTNGSSSTRPTATDEDAISAVQFMSGATSCASRLYIWRSTDGQMTRVIMRNATSGAYVGHWFWGKPRNPRTLWTDPCFYKFSNNAVLGNPIAVTAITAYLSTVKVVTVSQHGAVPANSFAAGWNLNNEWEGPNDYDTFRIYMQSITLAGARGGIIGEQFDTRACQSVVANGTLMPTSAPYTWCAFGDAATPTWLLPWDNTTPKFSAAP
jgi:hypothetical protein